jgi:hypothetical protein
MMYNQLIKRGNINLYTINYGVIKMGEYVGVIDTLLLSREEVPIASFLKQQALIFHRLAVPQLNSFLLNGEKITGEIKQVVAEMRWLYENGIVFDPQVEGRTIPSCTEREVEAIASIRHALGMIGILVGIDPNKILDTEDNIDLPEISDDDFNKIIKKLEKLPTFLEETRGKIAESPEFLEQVSLMTMHQARMFSIELREVDGFDAYPILANAIPNTPQSPADKNNVVRLVLNSLPVPDDSTPWQDILEYRNDPDSIGKFWALRNWMSDISRQQLTPFEVEEKLEHLLYEYQKHLKVHKIKTNRKSFEAIVVAAAEFLEDLANRRFSKLAKGLFTAKQRRIELLEGELNAPGKEVAYIVNTRERFQN